MNGNYEHADERYGFRWGPLVVQRLAHIKGRGRTLTIDTPYRNVQVGVSEAGRSVHVYVDGEKLLSPAARRADADLVGGPFALAALDAISDRLGSGPGGLLPWASANERLVWSVLGRALDDLQAMYDRRK